MDKSQINAINVIMSLHRLAIWANNILKLRVEKKSNECNQLRIISSRPFEEIFETRTLKKNQTNATNVTLSLLEQMIWRHIWKYTAEKNPMWSCLFSGRRCEATFQYAQWRKIKQMQPMRLCSFSYWPFEDTFEDAQWGKVRIMQPMWFDTLSCWPFDPKTMSQSSVDIYTIYTKTVFFWMIHGKTHGCYVS